MPNQWYLLSCLLSGPNHIATTNASSIPIILGEGPFRKSARYLTIVPPGDSGSLLATLDPHEHAKRRHIWEKGMNSKAVQGYKEVIHNRIQELVVILSQQQGQDLNLSTWLSYCSFDIMGDLAFNGQFNVMQTGSSEFVKKLQIFKKALGMQDYLMVLTWLRQYIPYVRKRYLNQAFWLVEFSMRAITQRMKEGSRYKDYFYHLLDEEHGGENALPLQIIFREANLIIPAGYDSTATANCHAFFYLLSNPTCFKKLRDEVHLHFSTVDEVYLNDDLVQNLPYLNAVINETLRLAPSLASGTQRYLPKGSANGGIKLGNTWIPEGTYIQIHTYSLHRNPKYFSPDPEAFHPERWLEDGYNTDRAAFVPFSYGPTNCIGKQIALLTLRKTICAMIVSFDFELSPEVNPVKWAEDTTERFILGRGELYAKVRKRS
ncbi:hypothetical protein Clacol_009636 [Clathrus columnatus]|uniref:Cytochrome P450 n=1 Tax=Clathrus columnatus TaxID=1419009 RepID=A0AAV5ALN6_9AGAM|nr:hypothetical protein Clacol_009636 [Clathrus columnatus]